MIKLPSKYVTEEQRDYGFHIPLFFAKEMAEVKPHDEVIVMVGARSTPFALVNQVFLVLALRRPTCLLVKVPDFRVADQLKDFWNVWHSYFTESRLELYSFTHESPDPDWVSGLASASIIFVYGSQEAIEFYRPFNSETCKVFEHGPKFSFGQINIGHEADLLDDFGVFQGEGCMSPKFYIWPDLLRTNQEPEEQILDELEWRYEAKYGKAVEKYRDETLTVAEKSELVQLEPYRVRDHIRVYGSDMSSNLQLLLKPSYGDIVLLLADSTDLYETFLSNQVSTFGYPYPLYNVQVRICKPGRMQFPGFIERHDEIDDYRVLKELE